MSIFNLLDDIEANELMPGFKGKFVHMENMTISYWEIAKGSILPEHEHPHEQTTNVIKGSLEMTINNETRVVEFGQVVAIPGNTKHSGKALTDCIVIDIFSPVREEYQNK